jgi:hypothetical protein
MIGTPKALLARENISFPGVEPIPYTRLSPKAIILLPPELAFFICGAFDQ